MASNDASVLERLRAKGQISATAFTQVTQQYIARPSSTAGYSDSNSPHSLTSLNGEPLPTLATTKPPMSGLGSQSPGTPMSTPKSLGRPPSTASDSGSPHSNVSSNRALLPSSASTKSSGSTLGSSTPISDKPKTTRVPDYLESLKSAAYYAKEVQVAESKIEKFAEDSITLQWRNVGYALPKGRGKEPKRILKNLSGDARPGEVIAILGGSGAGKTSLLNVLAGRVTSGVITGDIRINNQKRERHSWKRLVGYVEQDDLIDETLTVRELLTLVASLKLPEDMTAEEKLQLVDEVISQMRLNDCENTIIGDSVNRGISGGERKRAHIAMELITSPKCMFFDEPTTGLDSFNAYRVIDAIRETAKSGNKTMMMVVHQPREEILAMFDRIILLSQGRLAFTGNLEDAIRHFTTLGFPFPMSTNPGDYLLDITTTDHSATARRAKTIKNITNHWRDHKNQNIYPPFSIPPVEALKASGEIQTPSHLKNVLRNIRRWTILSRRNWIHTMRDKDTTLVLIIQTVTVIFLFGWLFWQQNLDQPSIPNRLGILFFLGLERFLMGLFLIVRILPSQRALIVRERGKSMYTASEIYFSKYFTDLITIFIQHVIVLIALYFMVGLQVDASKFGIYFGMGILLSLIAHSLGYLLGAIAPSVEVGLVMATMSASIFGMFSGNMVTPSNIPIWLRWIIYVNPLYYTFSSWSQNEFTGLVFNCPGRGCIPDGATVLSYRDLQGVPIVFAACALCGLWLVFTLLGYLAIRGKTRAPRIKLFV
ncbi:hypothetical protein SmJEL517_g02928 [Synchytrium microbalum]|uniref:ABC transporter domain-containing protein n=1 Tax=Synchytrium microbalum TaxID=1806994 RepID=A0A507C4E4_9FUNG|nr:uncharacterized protein SmJEL517_g02928 [Synchytrium microbalum]TPX34351.1 hypothetical protein SmJEL517_g02928 [Synchytrium microbalum]